MNDTPKQTEAEATSQGAAENPSSNFEELEDNEEARADSESGKHSNEELEAVYDIPVQVAAVLGQANMKVSQLLKLGRGAVVELDRKVGEPIDVFVNNRLVARGEVVIVDDRLGITMTEIVKISGGK